MKTTMKSLWLLPLAATVLLTACSTLPLSPTPSPSGVVQAANQGGLRVNLSGLQTLSSPELVAQISKAELILRMPDAEYVHTKPILASQLLQPLELSFEDLPVGNGEIEARLFDAQGQLLKSTKTAFRVKGGETSELQLAFILGGNSASDLILMLDAAVPRNVYSLWPYDPSFEYPDFGQDYNYEYVMAYRLIRPKQLDEPIVYRWRPGELTVTTGDASSSILTSSFSMLTLEVPEHAEYLGEFELPGYPRVKRVSFTNLLPTPEGEREITVERSYAPRVGLVQEILLEGGNVIATLVLDTYVTKPWSWE